MKLMDCIKDFEKMVMKEVENVVSKGALTPNDVHNIYEAVDVVKDLYTIEAMKMPEGYSQTGPMMYGNSYGMRWMTPEERFARGGYSGRYYDDPMHGGRSYEDGRDRDEMGRYSGMEDGYSGRRYR